MRLYVDSAEPAAIRQALSTGYVVGVTTNPTLLRRAGIRRDNIPSLVQTAAGAGAQEIHLQVLASSIEGMTSDGRWLHALDPTRVMVKVPATAEGFAAGARLAAEGIGVTVTAAFAPRQVVLAGAAGARYAAVYLGRMRDAGADPLVMVRRMLDVVHAQQMPLRLLVASVRALEDVEALAAMGVPCTTLPPDLLTALPHITATDEAARAFQEDAEHL